MNILIHVAESKLPRNFDHPSLVWTPWINCQPTDNIHAMAAHRHFRERGGLGEDDENLILYVCTKEARSVNWKKFSITRDHVWNDLPRLI